VVPERYAWQVLAVPGWNKGSAVELILEQMPAEAFPFYAGDAAGDRAPYLFTAGRGGVALGVGPEAEGEVRWLVPTPDALIDLLAQLLPAITVAGLK
jgi:trehalose-6-phosphatase